jgi:hypothetical protein
MKNVDKPNKEDIEHEIALAIVEGVSEEDKFSYLRYTDGVMIALEWVLGNIDYSPMEE